MTKSYGKTIALRPKTALGQDRTSRFQVHIAQQDGTPLHRDPSDIAPGERSSYCLGQSKLYCMLQYVCRDVCMFMCVQVYVCDHGRMYSYMHVCGGYKITWHAIPQESPTSLETKHLTGLELTLNQPGCSLLFLPPQC